MAYSFFLYRRIDNKSQTVTPLDSFTGQLLTIGILFNQYGLIPPLEKVPPSTPSCVKVIGVNSIDVMENAGKVGSLGPQE
jgi:hypothetical protein